MLQKDARQFSHSGCCLLGLSNLTKTADEKSVHIKRRQNWSYSSVYLFCRNVGVMKVEWAWCIHRKIMIDEGVRGHDLCAHCCRRRAMNSNWNPAKGFEEYSCGDSSLEPACLKALAAVTWQCPWWVGRIDLLSKWCLWSILRFFRDKYRYRLCLGF